MSGPSSIWGKWRSPDHYHPAVFHMLDVASVATRLYSLIGAIPPLRDALAGTDQSKWMGFIASLHDLGKISPAFLVHPSFSREEARIIRDRLEREHLPVPALVAPQGHGPITAAELPNILIDRFGMSAHTARLLARAAGAHHGRFAKSRELETARSPQTAGCGRWSELRAKVVDELASILGVPNSPPSLSSVAAAVALAGFISVADWIGSIEEYFPYAVSPDSDPYAFDARTYADLSVKRAEHALRELGWLANGTLSSTTTFESLFPGIVPNPLQRAAIDAASGLSEPALFIVEAPMGEGKTEAAMYLAQHFAERLGQRGCYFALPTQATSNQMFSRVRAFLEKARLGEVNLQLLHGHAALSAEFQTLRRKAADLVPSRVYDDAHDATDEDMSTVVAAEWFTWRKRGLLAPFGVGTVDQALMAVLQTKHYFVRLFGLAGKTIVIDEVHAYDAYMTTLMERLLQWLASLGSSVVLLSATLPASRRKAFVEAYLQGLGAKGQVSEQASYPRLTWVSAHAHGGRDVATSERSRRSIAIEWLDPGSLSDQLAWLLSDGGCAAVICNTVERAQDVYCSLKPVFPNVADDGHPELMLFHARFPFEQRDILEKLALLRFGKEGAEVDVGEGETRKVKRPRRAVIVATQVIEQSLDLDFDLMISEFAPADLVLQRAGRLHRHARARPAALVTPRMFLLGPKLDDDVPEFGDGTEAVYDRHILLRSWIALKGRKLIRVPEDVESLIESAYGTGVACPSGVSEKFRRTWAESEAELTASLREHQSKASQSRIPIPNESLFEKSADMEEDNPDVHVSLQARTRLSEGPTVSVILLPANAVDTDHKPESEEARTLLRREVRITHRGVASAILSDTSRRPKGWSRSPLLRHHRALLLDTSGRDRIGGYEVLVDPELGVILRRACQGIKIEC